MVDQIQRGPHTSLEREGERCPSPLADYLFCEGLGFAILPWEVADMDYDVYAYWQHVVGTYRAQREDSEAAIRRTGTGA